MSSVSILALLVLIMMYVCLVLLLMFCFLEIASLVLMVVIVAIILCSWMELIVFSVTRGILRLYRIRGFRIVKVALMINAFIVNLTIQPI